MAVNLKRKAAATVMFLLPCEDTQRKKLREIWVKEWISRRQEKGAFHCLMRELAAVDTSIFREFVHMDLQSFSNLLEILEPLVEKKDTEMRESIKAKERVAITLRYLATGESFRSLAFLFHILRQAISQIVEEVCNAIFEVIGSQHLKTQQKEGEWLRISSVFNQWWNFPNCLGAIDGKHIVMIQPGCTSGSHYRNYNGSDSVILLAVVGPNYEFLYVDVGANGRMSDGGIWNRSSLKACPSSRDNPLQIPPPQVLPSQTTPTSFVIVGDDAFSLMEYLMKPFPQTQLVNDENRIFNYRY